MKLMRALFVLTIGLILPALLSAQSKKVKIYAYKQAVIPGVRKVTIDESGSTKEVPNKINPNTLIYLEATSTKSIQPMHIWIDGKMFGLKTARPSLPVVIYHSEMPGKKADTLVRMTTNPVMQLLPEPTKEEFIPSGTAKRKMKSNQVVLHTIENGKNCYYYVDRIKILDPAVLQ